MYNLKTLFNKIAFYQNNYKLYYMCSGTYHSYSILSKTLLNTHLYTNVLATTQSRFVFRIFISMQENLHDRLKSVWGCLCIEVDIRKHFTFSK